MQSWVTSNSHADYRVAVVLEIGVPKFCLYFRKLEYCCDNVRVGQEQQYLFSEQYAVLFFYFKSANGVDSV